MGFLADYQDDIFISYAHIDNEALVEGQRGWIDTFREALARRLQVHLGPTPSIARDTRLHGNEYFSDSLTELSWNAAILITVISPAYIDSTWCRRERELFIKLADQKGGVLVKNRTRIFKVEKSHIGLEEHPEELQGIEGYRFYDFDEESHQFPEPQSLPVDLRSLSSYQGVYYSHEYFDAMIAKVVRYLKQS